MPPPLLLEINTRCWLRSLPGHLGRPVTLATVPEEQLASWKKHGFTHIWLMGVWATGPKTRDRARAQSNLRALSKEAFGEFGQDRLVSSPYAVADFTVAESLGGDAALRRFRSQLHSYGLGLILDFVPNHLGLDHLWLSEKTSLFVRSAAPVPETFPVTHAGTTTQVAYGKDPYFPPWIDTAQLDYRLASTRAAMIEVLQSVAAKCDGVRCDMAMLLLNDVFDKIWAHFPVNQPAPTEEFWAGAISAVKQRQPDFTFIAEAYWDLESRLQALGFDYVYDKKFLDLVTARDYSALQKHLRAVAGKFNPVRFLENHDEARIASRLTVSEQKAAAMLLLAQPGLRMLHDGQMSGKQRHTPAQFASYLPETCQPEITAFYDHLLSSLPNTALGEGEMDFCETGLPHCFAMKWKHEAGRHTLALVNLAPQRASFHMPDLEPRWGVTRVYSDNASDWNRHGDALVIELAACGFEMLECVQG